MSWMLGWPSQNDEWTVARNYMPASALEQAKADHQKLSEEIEAIKQLAAY